jgi:hypothetical protein
MRHPPNGMLKKRIRLAMGIGAFISVTSVLSFFLAFRVPADSLTAQAASIWFGLSLPGEMVGGGICGPRRKECSWRWLTFRLHRDHNPAQFRILFTYSPGSDSNSFEAARPA